VKKTHEKPRQGSALRKGAIDLAKAVVAAAKKAVKSAKSELKAAKRALKQAKKGAIATMSKAKPARPAKRKKSPRKAGKKVPVSSVL
jgi:hypothetical protein